MKYFILSLAVLISPLLHADDIGDLQGLSPQEQGLVIAKERKARDKGWGSSEAAVEMFLVSPQGEKSKRTMKMKTLEVDGDGDMALTVFTYPRDINGTAFLSHSHVDGADDQWLYLPSFKRVKRIASANKSGPFMGSEFAYEDLSSFEIAKYEFKLLEEEQLDNQPVYVVEQMPKDKHSGYIKQILWLNKQTFQPLKIEFYDRSGALAKELTLSDYRQYLDKYWRPHKLEMKHVQTNKQTALVTNSLEFDTGLTESDFSRDSLKRAR